jgi:hypothetical protein
VLCQSGENGAGFLKRSPAKGIGNVHTTWINTFIRPLFRQALRGLHVLLAERLDRRGLLVGVVARFLAIVGLLVSNPEWLRPGFGLHQVSIRSPHPACNREIGVKGFHLGLDEPL